RHRGQRAERRRRLLARAAELVDLELRRDAAVRRGRRAARGDREILGAVDGVERRAAGDLMAGLERPEDLPGLQVERAQDAVAAAGEAQAARGRRDAAALGLRRLELPDALTGVDVDRADRAVVVPAGQHRPEVAVLQPEEDVAERELALLLRRRQLRLRLHRRGLGGAVED